MKHGDVFAATVEDFNLTVQAVPGAYGIKMRQVPSPFPIDIAEVVALVQESWLRSLFPVQSPTSAAYAAGSVPEDRLRKG
jgi:hypothetical protein